VGGGEGLFDLEEAGWNLHCEAFVEFCSLGCFDITSMWS
jgi:hypothetical protein